jgi:hypothetical protein
LLPALAELFDAGELSDDFRVIGAAREDWNDATFRQHAAERLEKHAAADVSAASRERLLNRLRYRKIDFGEPETVALAVRAASDETSETHAGVSDHRNRRGCCKRGFSKFAGRLFDRYDKGQLSSVEAVSLSDCEPSTATMTLRHARAARRLQTDHAKPARPVFFSRTIDGAANKLKHRVPTWARVGSMEHPLEYACKLGAVDEFTRL